MNLGVEIRREVSYNTLKAIFFLNEQAMSYICNKVRRVPPSLLCVDKSRVQF